MTAVLTRPLIPTPRTPVEPMTRHTRAVAYQRVLHQAIRREFRLLAELTSWAPADDAARTADLTGHADLLARVLLQHHATERELLWPAAFRHIPAREQDAARDAVAYWTSRAALLDHMLRACPRSPASGPSSARCPPATPSPAPAPASPTPSTHTRRTRSGRCCHWSPAICPTASGRRSAARPPRR